VSNPTVTANSTATGTVTIYTSEAACSATAAVKKGATRHSFAKTGAKSIASRQQSPASHAVIPISAAAAFAGLLLFGLRKRRSALWTPAQWTMLSCFLLLAVIGVTVGCGSGSSTSTSTDVSKGTYTLTLDGADSSDSSNTAATTFTLTVD
jgi:hypothetical protein